MDNIFFTQEHDWISFSDTWAAIGISKFKLTGIPKIDDIGLFDYKPGDRIEAGTIMLHLYYKEYVIPVYAPVTCTLLEINPTVGEGAWEHIVAYPESEGWLFKVDAQQQDKSHLLNYALYKEQFSPDNILKS